MTEQKYPVRKWTVLKLHVYPNGKEQICYQSRIFFSQIEADIERRILEKSNTDTSNTYKFVTFELTQIKKKEKE